MDNNWQESYNRLVKSPVFLEEVQHVYIHKVTKERYTSVTTVLSLIKNEFPDSVKSAIVKQYQVFLKWLAKQGYDNFKRDKKTILRCLELYINYKHLRPFSESEFSGQKIYKNITTYKSLKEFLDEFLELQENHTINRKKNIYLNKDGSIMSEVEMQKMWYDITDVANIYGTMVHEIVEQYIILKQRFISQNNIEQSIEKRFNHLRFFLESLDYPYSPHAFTEYYIYSDVETFKNHIITSFNALRVDLGRVCVPERLMFNETYKVSGMCDVFIEYDDEFFGIGDHKTNKNFTTESEYGNKLKAPFDHLDECDLILYNLQLSIYALLYELETGKKLKHMWISYYSRRESKFICIQLKYLKQEALELLTIHRNFLEEKSITYKDSGIFNNTSEIYHNHLIFVIEKMIKKHNVQGFYKDKSKLEIRKFFDKFIRDYVKSQELIEIPIL